MRQADHPIDPLFLDRWSPRAMSGEAISDEELMTLLEAARWAPSSGNGQPWRMLYAKRDTPHWEPFFSLLAEGNQVWVVRAAVLIAFVSERTDDKGRPRRTHSFDTGAAWENLALQGARMGLVIHAMAGLDYEKAHVVFRLPERFAVEAMVAVGRPGDISLLSENLQEREKPNSRRPLSETVFEGAFPSDE